MPSRNSVLSQPRQLAAHPMRPASRLLSLWGASRLELLAKDVWCAACLNSSSSCPWIARIDSDRPSACRAPPLAYSSTRQAITLRSLLVRHSILVDVLPVGLRLLLAQGVCVTAKCHSVRFWRIHVMVTCPDLLELRILRASTRGLFNQQAPRRSDYAVFDHTTKALRRWPLPRSAG